MPHEDLRGRRILVVEDDDLLARNLCVALQSAGAEVIGPAARLNDALALVESAAPDGAVLVLDLDGTLTTAVLVALRMRNIPFVLAMDDVVAYPAFWPDIRRCEKPVGVEKLANALLEAARRQPARPSTIEAIAVKITNSDPDRRPVGETIGHNIGEHLQKRRLEAEIARQANAGRKLDPADIPLIELDATRWRNVLDFYDALKRALRSPDGHGGSPDAWVDSMIYGGMNGVEPPYVIRIVGTAHCRAGLKAEIDLLAEVIRDARAWKLEHYGVDVEVSFQIES